MWVAIAGIPNGHLYGFDQETGKQRSITTLGWAPAALSVTRTVIVVSDSQGDGSQPALQANLVELVDPVSGVVQGSVAVQAPGYLVDADGLIWVVSGGPSADSVQVLDPATRRLLSRDAMPGRVSALSAALGYVWATVVGDDGGETLMRIDPATRTVSDRFNLAPQQIAAVVPAGQALATVAEDEGGIRLEHIDPVTGAPSTVASWADVNTFRLHADALVVVGQDGLIEEVSPLDGARLAGPSHLPDLGDGALIDMFRQGSDLWVVSGTEAFLLAA